MLVKRVEYWRIAISISANPLQLSLNDRGRNMNFVILWWYEYVNRHTTAALIIRLIPAWISNHMTRKVLQQIHSQTSTMQPLVIFPYQLFKMHNYLFVFRLKLINVCKRGHMLQKQHQYKQHPIKWKWGMTIIYNQYHGWHGNSTTTYKEMYVAGPCATIGSKYKGIYALWAGSFNHWGADYAQCVLKQTLAYILMFSQSDVSTCLPLNVLSVR